MYRFLAVAVLLLGLGAPAVWGQAPVVPIVLAAPWFMTEPFRCGVESPRQAWTNTTGATLRISSVEVWAGMDQNAVADLAVNVVARHGGGEGLITSYLFSDGWDHYVNPTNWHSRTRSFWPGAIAVPPGDAITLHVGCNGFGRPWAAHVAVSFVYWWE